MSDQAEEDILLLAISSNKEKETFMLTENKQTRYYPLTDPGKNEGVSGMSDCTLSSTAPSRKRSLALRLCIWAGVIGPILFVFVFSLDGFLKPNYTSLPISYLELGANGWIQSANFIVLGLLLMLFALGFSQRMDPLIKRLPLLASTVLLLLVGLAFANDGVFIPAAPTESADV